MSLVPNWFIAGAVVAAFYVGLITVSFCWGFWCGKMDERKEHRKED